MSAMKLWQELDHAPSTYEVAEHSGMDRAEVLKTYRILEGLGLKEPAPWMARRHFILTPAGWNAFEDLVREAGLEPTTSDSQSQRSTT